MDDFDAFRANGNLLEERAMRVARVRYDREMCYYHLMNRVAGEPGVIASATCLAVPACHRKNVGPFDNQ